VVEDPLGRAGSLIEAPPEDVPFLPEREHPHLERGQVHLRVDRPVPRHPFAPARSSRGAKEIAPSRTGTRRVPRGTTLLGPPSRAAPTRRPRWARRPPRPTAVTGGARPRLLRAPPLGDRPVRAAARGGCSPGPATGLPPSPARSWPGCPGTRSRRHLWPDIVPSGVPAFRQRRSWGDTEREGGSGGTRRGAHRGSRLPPVAAGSGD